MMGVGFPRWDIISLVATVVIVVVFVILVRWKPHD
jgi:hypothetical protein